MFQVIHDHNDAVTLVRELIDTCREKSQEHRELAAKLLQADECLVHVMEENSRLKKEKKVACVHTMTHRIRLHEYRRKAKHVGLEFSDDDSVCAKADTDRRCRDMGIADAERILDAIEIMPVTPEEEQLYEDLPSSISEHDQSDDERRCSDSDSGRSDRTDFEPPSKNAHRSRAPSPDVSAYHEKEKGKINGKDKYVLAEEKINCDHTNIRICADENCEKKFIGVKCPNFTY